MNTKLMLCCFGESKGPGLGQTRLKWRTLTDKSQYNFFKWQNWKFFF